VRCDVFQLHLRGIEGGVCGFAIERFALGHEVGQRLSRVWGLEEGAPVVPGDAFEEGIERGGEPDDEAGLFQGFTVLGSEYGAAAGCDDAAGHVSDGFDGDGFDASERLLPVGPEDLSDFSSGARFDEFVDIDDLEPYAFGEDTPHGGFPAAHETDEDDVLRAWWVFEHAGRWNELGYSVQDMGRGVVCILEVRLQRG